MSKTKFGEFGGQYVPEILMNEVKNLEKAYEFYKNDEQFNKELNDLLKNYAGRPSLLYFAKNMTEDLDLSLKSLGNMYDDEQRAREQLSEIEKFLKASKNGIRNYKLPVISDKYFVELNEANEAISEVIKELSKKPIVIKTLNTRVDTARDLVLKLYNTTNDMIKLAALTENCIIYANRYRSSLEEVNDELVIAEKNFFKGNYNEAFLRSLNAISFVDSNTYTKLIKVYEGNNL